MKVKLESQDEEGPVGLVPSAYVEPVSAPPCPGPVHPLMRIAVCTQAQPISTVKALYEYDANAEGELSLEEDEVLHLFAKDEDWFLVESQKEGGKIGYIPGNYVEDVRYPTWY